VRRRLCPPETAQQLQQQIPSASIEAAHQSLLQAQQDLAILACAPPSATPGMPAAAIASGGSGLVPASGHMQANASSAMMWTAQAQAQAMQQQQAQAAQQQQMQVHVHCSQQCSLRTRAILSQPSHACHVGEARNAFER